MTMTIREEVLIANAWKGMVFEGELWAGLYFWSSDLQIFEVFEAGCGD